MTLQKVIHSLKKFKSRTIYNPNKWIKRLWMSMFAFLGILGFFIAYILVSGIPSFEELENPKSHQASIIYDVHGRIFGKYFIENREIIAYDEINPKVLDALLATEDARYYEHSGIDFLALSRVAFKTLLFQRESSGGGSTITQQLAKLLYKRPKLKDRNFLVKAFLLVSSKVKEWIVAVKLERRYTKEEIITMYLNQFEFINGAHGIQSASQIYFNKNQENLATEEAALLIGMLKNPSLYNPKRFPEKAKERRNVVLALMNNAGKINSKSKDSLLSTIIDMSNFRKVEQSEGPAPHFRAELTKWVENLFKQKGIRKQDGTEYNVYTDGLKIHTTIDLSYQKYAEQASKEHMAWLQDWYWKTWKDKNPWTFEANEIQKKQRLEALDSRAKSSDRYLSMRKKEIGNIIDKIEKKFPQLKTPDKIISLLIANEKKIEVLDTLETIKKDLKRYKELINNNLWTELKPKFATLQEKYKKEYDTKIKMIVFDHKEGEKEVEMTPLDSVRYVMQHLQNAMLAIDPTNGHIKAWVGGLDHRHFKYDHVTSRRSVGSIIKPFVYTAAMSFSGISPCQEYEDIQYTIAPGDANFRVDKEWTPANSTEIFTGNMYNLYHGLLYSKNSITVRLLKEMGNVEVLRDLMHKAGIDKNEVLPNGRLAVQKYPSICLGAIDVTLLRMTGAYTTFANQGTYTEPIFVTSITDKQGKEIYSNISKKTPAINPLYNAVMVDMLKNNVSDEFTLGLKTPNGGKTGTTNDFTDGWFMGVTPKLVVGVWTGGDDKFIRFTDIDIGQGYVTARPAFQKFMQKLEADTTGFYNPKVNFADPPEGYYELIDCGKYKTIRPETERKQRLYQKMEHEEFDDEF